MKLTSLLLGSIGKKMFLQMTILYIVLNEYRQSSKSTHNVADISGIVYLYQYPLAVPLHPNPVEV